MEKCILASFSLTNDICEGQDYIRCVCARRPIIAIMSNSKGEAWVLKMTELWYNCPQALIAGNGKSPRERSVMKSIEMKGIGEVKINYNQIWTCGVWRLLSLYLILLWFIIFWLGSFFSNSNGIMFHFTLEVCDLHFVFIFQAIILHCYINFRRIFEIWTSNKPDVILDYGKLKWT